MEAGPTGLGIAIGVALGVIYVAVSFLSNRRALRSKQRFMLIAVATMITRIFVALVLLIGILLLLPVSATAVLGSFFMIFVIGLAAEAWFLHRRRSAVQDEGG